MQARKQPGQAAAMGAWGSVASPLSTPATPRAGMRPTRHCLLWPAMALLALCQTAAHGANAASTTAGPSVPDQVVRELRAASRARSQLLKEEQAWAMEKEKLLLLKSAIENEAQRHTRLAADAKRQESALEAGSAQLAAQRDRLVLVEAMIDALAQRLEAALDELHERALPGLIPPDQAAAILDPGQRLTAAAQRLAQAKHRAEMSSIEIVSGRLGSQTLTVKLLRLGSVASWWVSLDERQAGTARAEAGGLVLTLAATAEGAAEIKTALAIAEGRAAPEWVVLPMQHVKLHKTPSGSQ